MLSCVSRRLKTGCCDCTTKEFIFPNKTKKVINLREIDVSLQCRGSGPSSWSSFKRSYLPVARLEWNIRIGHWDWSQTNAARRPRAWSLRQLDAKQ